MGTFLAWLLSARSLRYLLGESASVPNPRHSPSRQAMSLEAGAAAVLAVPAGPPAAKAAPKKRGRPQAGTVPRIDFDMQIEEANRVSEMSRKMLKAARNLRKATQKSKARLMKKAAKLRPEDLERIAVIKRFLKSTTDAESEGPSAASSSAASSCESVQDISAAKKTFHQALLQRTGTMETMEAVLASSAGTVSVAAALGRDLAQDAGPASPAGGIPRARLLQRGVSSDGMGSQNVDGAVREVTAVEESQRQDADEDEAMATED